MTKSYSLDRTILSLAGACPLCSEQFDEPTLVCPHDGTLLAQGLLPGTVIANRYQYLSTIGNGGMGLIIKAHDTKVDVDIALKMLLRNNSKTEIKRFEQEAKAVSILNHKNIISLRDFGVTEDDCPYMVMEYVDGEDLSSVLSKRGAMPLSEATEIFDQLCDAMSYAHSRGVMHRDLKPSNIMLTNSENSVTIKIVDFGIAKIVGPEGVAQKNITQTGQIVGSPIYMSPEQSLGKPLDARTDIYSAACIFYHMVTGAPPIIGASAIETLFKHVNEVPLRLTSASIGGEFGKDLEDVIDKALQKDPVRRQQTFAELKRDLHQALQGKAKVAEERERNPEKRLRRTVLIVAAASICLAAATYLAAKNNATNQSRSEQMQTQKPPVTVEPITSESKSASHSPKPSASAAEDNPIDNFDINLTADSLAHQEMNYEFNTKSKFLDFADNDRTVTNKTIDFLVAAIQDDPSRLRSLDLQDTSIDDKGIEALVKLAPRLKLKTLKVGDTKISEVGLRYISKINTLEELNIERTTGLKSESLSCLSELHSLQVLNINGCCQNFEHPVDLRFLLKLKHLTTLVAAYNGGAIDDSSTTLISKLPLTYLDLSFDHVGNPGLRQLSHMKHLETLKLKGKLITDDSIPSLAGMFNLKKLDLAQELITDKALANMSAMHDRGQIDLNALNVAHCVKLTPQACQSFQQDNRLCVVSY